jgi:FkbM family methyltransferase
MLSATEYFKSPDGRNFLVPLGTNPAELYFIFDEIYGNLKIYEHEECPVSDGDIVIDLGSNIGVFALRALDKFHAGLVVCVEAEPINAECLKTNLANYGFGEQIIVVNKAIFSHNEGLKLNIVPNSSIGHFISDNYPHMARPECEINIPSITIDSLVQELKLNSVDFMKFDTEGCEVAAIQGGEETIRKFKPKMVITTYHKPEHPEQIYKLVKMMRPDYNTKFVDKGIADKVLVCW